MSSFHGIATKPASECVFMGGGGCYTPLPPPIGQFRNNSCKDDSALFSRFLHAFKCCK